MKLGSLFDGSGGFPLAGSLCGIEPVWAAEVEPYPIAVTRSRFPKMKHLGNICNINGAEIEPVDIITFGSPCQDLSVAGKRAGLKHEDNGDDETTRSGLFMEAVRIIKEMRSATNGRYPTFALWENVPGAFSSNQGEDFRIVLQELIQIAEPTAKVPAPPKGGWAYSDIYLGDGWSLAYRVFDAQYWGVPQRRRRIHLIADFRGGRAGEVLFKSEGLCRNSAESGEAWQGVAGDAEDCSGATDREGENGCLIAVATQQGGAEISDNGICPTITAAAGMSGNNQPWICSIEPSIAAREGGHIVEASGFKELNSSKARSDAYEHEVAPTLSANKHDASVCACVYSIENHPADSGVDIDESGKVQTLTSRMGTGGGNVPMVMERKVFRKGTRPHSSDEAQKWEPADVANTLNTFDQGEARANELVVTKVYESHPMDSRITELDGVSPTVSAKWHKGAADTPLVCEGTPVYCLQGNGIDRADTAGCNGKGVKEDVCYTLNTIDRPAVAFKTYQKVTGPLMANSHPGSYTGQDAFSDMLVAGEEPISIDRAFFNQGQNAQYDPQYYTDGTVPTLVAKGPSAVCHKQEVRYIVRRLTPTECARLQGFPDKWGHPDPKTELTDEEYAFWCKVNLDLAIIGGTARPNDNGWYNIWREVNPDKNKGEDFEPYDEDTGKPYAHKNQDQMLKWYNKLHTDSAEYKMWGNGIALPPALCCMQGMAQALGVAT